MPSSICESSYSKKGSISWVNQQAGMAKYNITPRRERKASLSYRNTAPPDFVEEVATKIIQKLMIEQKYRDPNYSAGRLAKDIGVSARHISVVINVRFQQNYSQLLGWMRVSRAKYMLQDEHFENMKMEDIAVNVGYTTRQSFYAAFYRQCGKTPKEYKMMLSEFHPEEEKEE